MRRKIADNQAQPLATEPRLLNERQVAEMTGLALSTLRHWRLKRVGPPYIKFGRRRQAAIRYPLHDLLAWAASFRVETRPEAR
jgi:predicted DNA-binding transcriptional regulator AlpA